MDPDLRRRVAELSRELALMKRQVSRLESIAGGRTRREARLGRSVPENELVTVAASQVAPATGFTFSTPGATLLNSKQDLTGLGIALKTGDPTKLQFKTNDQTWLCVSQVLWVVNAVPGAGEFTCTATLTPTVGSLLRLAGGVAQDHYVLTYLPAATPPNPFRPQSCAVSAFTTCTAGTQNPIVELGFAAATTHVGGLVRADAFFAFMRVR